MNNDVNASKDWLSLYESMKDGKMDYNAKYYVNNASEVDTSTSQDGQSDIKLVTPTQAQVDQAKVQLKRRLSSIAPTILAAKRRKMSGKGVSTKNKSKQQKGRGRKPAVAKRKSKQQKRKGQTGGRTKKNKNKKIKANQKKRSKRRGR